MKTLYSPPRVVSYSINQARQYLNPVRWFSSPQQQLEHLLLSGKHEALEEYCHRLQQQAAKYRQRNKPPKILQLSLFYQAKSRYYFGQTDQTSEILDKYFYYWPWDANAHYLAADNYRVAGNRCGARQQLLTLYPNSQRLKTWLYLAELVEDAEHWQQMLYHVEHAQRLQLAPDFHPSLSDYMAMGAQRGADYDYATQLWRKVISQKVKHRLSLSLLRSRRKPFTPGRAKLALSDLQQTLLAVNIPIFLISGTLLGCVRENAMLGHDQDIDVGISANIDQQLLINALRHAGYFHLLPQRYNGCLRVRHINGIAIDIFVHYLEAERVWHGGSKVRWHNTPFKLQQVKFVGEQYWIPDQPERYLEENYGDWQTPRKSFDSTLDTPNADILCQQELIIHCYKKLYKAIASRNISLIKRYQLVLTKLGEKI